MRERLRQLISDLSALPERQRGALLMREAAGLDFDEIGAALGTTAAVARQTLYEARLGLREMDSGREMNCTAATRALSDGDRRVRRRRDIRAHLRDCASCRGFVEEIDGRRADLAAIAPLPAVAAAALLHGVVAGGSAGAGVAAGAGAAGKAGASGAGGVGAVVAGSAAKSVGTVTLLKGAATVAVVVAVGAVVADGAAWSTSAITTRLRHPDRAPYPSLSRTEATQVPPAGRRERGWRGSRSRIRQPREGRSSKETARARNGHGSVTAAAVAAGSRKCQSTPGEPGKRQGRVQTPPKASHGQETAAANHAAHEDNKVPPGKASAEHPAHPAHPVHPDKPETPAKGTRVAAGHRSSSGFVSRTCGQPSGSGRVGTDGGSHRSFLIRTR